MKRTPLKRKTPLRSKPKPKLTEQQLLLRRCWYLSVTRKDGRLAPCIVCGRRRAIHAHHVVSRQFLWRNASDFLLDGESKDDATERMTWAFQNGAPVCEVCHMGHENASKRIPRNKLPLHTLAWAHEQGLASYIRRHYPEEE